MLTASQPTAALPATRSRLNVVLVWALQILLGLFFAYAGLNKLLGLAQEQEITTNFAKFGLGPGFRYVVATLELAGGLGLLVPRVAGLAAIWLMGVMVGAIVSHFTVLPPAYFATGPAIIILLLSPVAWAYRGQIQQVLGALRRAA